ncbi:hypothetical protein Hanom_Chr04g00332541 [Helianthus anomalus]
MMVHDPDPEVLLRITICQRNKDHWLGSCVRIMYDKNPALTLLTKKNRLFQLIPMRPMAYKVIHLCKLRHSQINTLLLNDSFKGMQDPPHHWNRLNIGDVSQREERLGEIWKRVRISYCERGDWESYPGFGYEIAQNGGIKGFEYGVCRKTVADSVYLWISEATSFSHGVFDDPLALKRTVFLMILSWRGS